MLDKSLDQMDKAYIESLIADKVVEAKHLDYKETLPGDADREKNRFVEDVCSFASAAGGDIFFGIRDKRDAGGQKTGAPEYVGLKGLNLDQEKLRLEHIILNKVEPRISGIQFRLIEGFENGPILIMRIPRSYNAPHVTKHDGRFRSRANSGNYVMDVQEIRNAFIASETLPERIRQFRADRLSKIVAGEIPVPLSEGGKLVLHLIPFSAFRATSACDISQIEGQLRSKLALINGYADTWRYNVDGLVTIGLSSDSRNATAYTQVFRNGNIEAVDSTLLQQEGDRHIIPSVAYEYQLLDRIEKYVSVLDELGVESPILIMLTLLRVLGYELATAPRFQVGRPTLIDRDTIVVPEVMLENLRPDIRRAMKPAFDVVWNACGYANSMNYDDDGNWKPLGC